MNKKFIGVFAIVLVGLGACQSNGSKEVVLDTEMKRVSYAYGMNMGDFFLKQGLDSMDLDAFVLGCNEHMDSSIVTKLTIDSAGTVVNEFFKKANEAKQKAQEETLKVEGAKNLSDAEEFLRENKTREGVIETESGLQYEVIKQGTGATPVDGQIVLTHYHGTLMDGSVFDSSYDRGEPISFGVNQVIPGWTEALKTMKVGEKRKLYLHPELAYGQRSPSPKIGPNALLIFDMELLEIVKDSK